MSKKIGSVFLSDLPGRILGGDFSEAEFYVKIEFCGGDDIQKEVLLSNDKTLKYNETISYAVINSALIACGMDRGVRERMICAGEPLIMFFRYKEDAENFFYAQKECVIGLKFNLTVNDDKGWILSNFYDD